MIFVTVGTHEQPFNRLVKEIDQLKASGAIEEEVVIQTGYSTYEPHACRFSQFFPYQEMQGLIAEARIVVSHGAPATFLSALQHGKTPIVVPRQKQFGEHVNDHQLEFSEAIATRQNSILLIKDIATLEDTLKNYDSLVAQMAANGPTSNNAAFNEKLEALVKELLDE